jgi:YVTN family beta-propeller protein
MMSAKIDGSSILHWWQLRSAVGEVAMKLRIRGLLATATLLVACLLGSAQSLAQNAYITNFGSNTVSVIATVTNTVSATIPVGGAEPYGVAVAPDSSKVYVANQSSGTVSVIATATNTVSATIPVGSFPYGVAVTTDGSKVYVANEGSNTVSVIATATNMVTATIPVGAAPEGVAVSPDGSKVYVVDEGSGTVAVIDTATNTVSATIQVGTFPEGVAVSPDGNKVYVANFGSDNVAVIATATNMVTATIPGIYEPQTKSKHPVELYETILSVYQNTPRERLLEFMGAHPNIGYFRSLPQLELAKIYAEGIATNILTSTKRGA